MVLYAATTSAGKIRDFAAAGRADAVGVLPLPGMQQIAAPPEDEPDFAGNARSKAIYYSRQAPGLMVLADDSGLEVDALDGAPGVHSARFADDHGYRIDVPLSQDERNNLCLLDALLDLPPAGRTGRYRCALALACDGNLLLTAEGSVDGTILTAPRGTDGFGYDPLFYLPEREKTMAEMDAAEKWEWSHRGRAFRALIQQLGPLDR